MIAVDTNVVVRLLVADDASQAARARRLFEREQVLVVETVLLETEWVLRGFYRLEREVIVRLLRGLLGLPRVTLDHPQRVAQVLANYAAGFDFADALHLAQSASTDRFVSFDEPLIKRSTRAGTTPRVSLP